MSGALLTGPEIQAMMLAELIKIDPYNPEQLNPNSYNVRLADTLCTYRSPELDMKKDHKLEEFKIPEEGFVLRPDVLYLGRTVEYTETKYPNVPMLEGRSSVGRLGLNVHITAGFGDVGFKGTWTLEMTCVHPLRIYPNIEIAQLYYLRTYGAIPKPYDGKYQGEKDPLASKLHEELKCSSQSPTTNSSTSPTSLPTKKI